MAIDFPNSPNVNDVFTVGNKTWTWDGVTWKSTASGSSNLAGLSSVIIANPQIGHILKWDGTNWVNTTPDNNNANNVNPAPADVAFTYYNGPDTSSSSAANTSRQVTGTGTQADPFVLGTILVDATTGQTNLTGSTHEEIIIQGTAGQPVEFVAINDTTNKFDQPSGVIDANGQWKGHLFYNGYIHQNSNPTDNSEYTIDIKIGSTSVYFRWTVCHITSYTGTTTQQIFDDPGEVVVKFTSHLSSPCKYSCATNSVMGAFYDASQFTYTRGADGYRFTSGGVITTRYNCGHPHNTNCQDSGYYKTLWKLEFLSNPFKYKPGTWFTNLDDPTHTVNVPTTNNAFTGAFDSGRATSTGGTMSWNPEYATPGTPSGVKFKYSVELYDDNSGTESRAKVDGTWGSWVQHNANGWVTVASAPVAGTESKLQHIETRAHTSAPTTLPGFYAVKVDANANSKYGVAGAIMENKEEATPLYMDGYLPYEDVGSWYNVSEWGHWQGSKCVQSGWWGIAFYTCKNEFHWTTLDQVTYTAFPNTNSVDIGNITPYPLGYDLINGVKTVYASQNPTLFNYTNDGYADPNYFTYAWSTTSTGVTFDDPTKREPEVSFDANDPGLKTLTLTITSNETGITDSPATGSVEVNALASYRNETIGTVTITAGFWDTEDVVDSTDVLERWRADVTYDGTTSLANYQWSVTDAFSPVAPVIDTPNADQTFITFRYDPSNNAHMGNRTITCTITATDSTDSPASDSETIYMPS